MSAPTRGRQKMGEIEGKLGTKSGSFLLGWIGQSGISSSQLSGGGRPGSGGEDGQIHCNNSYQ